jgi:hypothetical protein
MLYAGVTNGSLPCSLSISTYIKELLTTEIAIYWRCILHCVERSDHAEGRAICN